MHFTIQNQTELMQYCDKFQYPTLIGKWKKWFTSKYLVTLILNDNFPLFWILLKFFREGGPYSKRNNLKLILERKFLQSYYFHMSKVFSKPLLKTYNCKVAQATQVHTACI